MWVTVSGEDFSEEEGLRWSLDMRGELRSDPRGRTGFQSEWVQEEPAGWAGGRELPVGFSQSREPVSCEQALRRVPGARERVQARFLEEK